MTMTPTDQRPQECEYYCKLGFFEWFVEDFPHCYCSGRESRYCIYGKRKYECPYFIPKTEKDGK